MSEAPLVTQKYCAFLDLLGIRSLLKNFDVALEFYLDATKELQYWPDCLAELNNFLQSNKNHHNQSDQSFTYSIFSDSFTASSETMTWTITTAFQVAHHCVQAGVPVRGAISFGRHFERIESSHHFILSEGFTRAYELESKKAIYPRVLLDPNYLVNFEATFKVSKSPTAAAIQAADDFWCINVLPFDYDYPVLARIVKNIISELSNETSEEKVRVKWAWFGDYFNAVVWGRSGVYEHNCEPSFRKFLRSSFDGVPVVAPMWDYEEFPEYKFFLSGRTKYGKIHDFKRSFKENYALQIKQAERSPKGCVAEHMIQLKQWAERCGWSTK